jgi:hypothetical protein
MLNTEDLDNQVVFTPPAELIGAYGTLVAQVSETVTRKSYHVGDLFRGIFPVTPDLGEVVTLGKGRLTQESPCQIGLKPLADVTSDWLDPNALYRVHDQTVTLWFYPDPTEKT